MEYAIYVLLGIALAASCGFRVFVPMLVVSIASYSGYVELAPNFAWLGSLAALIIFAIASVLEIVAYYVPWLDNILDTVATPAAIVAGILVSASFITDMNPLLKWILAVVAGGGAAGLVQTATVGARTLATATTARVGNPIVSTLENIASLVISVLSVVLPVVGIILAFAVIAFLIYFMSKMKRSFARAKS